MAAGIARNKALMHWCSEKPHPLLADSRVVEGIDEVFDGLDRSPAEIDWWESRNWPCVTVSPSSAAI